MPFAVTFISYYDMDSDLGVTTQLEINRLHLGRANLWPWWKFNRLQRDYWRIYLNGGKGSFIKTKNQDYLLEPDKVLIIPEGIDFSSHPAPKTEQVFIHFEFISPSGYLLRKYFTKPEAMKSSDPDKALFENRHMLPLAGHTGPPLSLTYEFLAKATIQFILFKLFDKLPNLVRKEMELDLKGKSSISPAIEYINNNISEKLSNDILAKKCYISRDHFIRTFKEIVGISPGQYILRKRVSLAEMMLINTNKSIDEISEECGFGNRFYFSRMFKRILENSPAKHRNIMKV